MAGRSAIDRSPRLAPPQRRDLEQGEGRSGQRERQAPKRSRTRVPLRQVEVVFLRRGRHQVRAEEEQAVVKKQWCPFTNTKCFKVRKSEPDISIETCFVRFGKNARDVVICPNRLLERRQVFTDCLHLLTRHDPGNELHIVREVSIPGGSVDYFLASVKKNKVKDFVAIEFQTLDTTGIVWPEQQRLLASLGFAVSAKEAESGKTFGMNWN
ncbi:MAG: hypothetical protein WBC44_05210 [Planctomycetaceae bacterium]